MYGFVVNIFEVVDLPELSLAGIRRIMRKAGAERVSRDAVEVLRDATEDFVLRVAKVAVELAKHAKRRTVQKSDVRKALELVLRH